MIPIKDKIYFIEYIDHSAGYEGRARYIGETEEHRFDDGEEEILYEFEILDGDKRGDKWFFMEVDIVKETE